MKKVFIPFMVALCIALGIVIGNFYSKLKTQKQLSLPFDRIVKTNDKISDVLDIIEEFYVDTIVRDSLVEQVIPEIISQLDPHSSYIPAKDLQMVNEELSGSFFGIGVQFNLQNDTIYVINVISGGPSEKVGIMAGDRIVRVNDSVFVGKKVTNEKVISTLRGDKGTKIKLGIVRRGSKEITNYVVTRGEVQKITAAAASAYTIPAVSENFCSFIHNSSKRIYRKYRIQAQKKQYEGKTHTTRTRKYN